MPRETQNIENAQKRRSKLRKTDDTKIHYIANSRDLVHTKIYTTLDYKLM